MHPLRGTAPVTWRCTRYVTMHPLRGDAPDQNGCNAYGSGAPHNARIPQRRVCRPARITHRQEHTKPQDPQAPPVWRAPEGPEGQAAVPVGGGGAWPGFETTRRAKLAARMSRGRASGTRNTSGATSTPVETFFAPACGSSTTNETLFAHAHPKWLIFDHFHRAGAIFLSQSHPERPPGATQGRSFFHAAPSGP